MPAWRDDKILELANQLTYSPAEKRREQLRAAVGLLSAVDPGKTYPWDFVHFRVTGFAPRGHIEHTVAGKILRADLATLIEFLSDTLAIKVEEAGAFGAEVGAGESGAGDAALTMEEVTKQFTVSSKTIQRWRKQGLIALRYVYPDGRRRLGFLESAVRRFAAENKERVEKSAAFKQLTEEEKAQIIKIARRFVAYCRCSIKEVSQRIGRRLNRSPETIRYTIRKYDRDHPEAALFPERDEESDTLSPVQSFQQPGHEKSAETAPAPPPLPHTSIYRMATRERALRIKDLKIEFMANPLFEHPDAEGIILQVLPAEALARARATVLAGTNAKASDVYMARMPRDLPAFLQDIFRQPVMPHELETDAFRRMNYLKWKAARLQAAMRVDESTPTELAEIETLLVQAQEIGNQIVQSNLRVSVHVARKHQRPDRPLMELVSDATVWLMRAAEKFDFSRPARFSTYASYAIMKNFARDRAEQLTRRDPRLVTGQEAVLAEAGAPTPAEGDAGERIDAGAMQADLLSVIGELPERERELLTRHYGLEENKPAMSLSEIGSQMGITKARVRQLEARALRKLRLLLETRGEKLRAAADKPR